MIRYMQIVILAAIGSALAAPAHSAGALAIGACGAYGEAHDFANIALARAGALRQCRGEGCKVVANLRGNCAAFAIDGANPCGPSAYASGPHLGRAQNAALRGCYAKGGRECVIRMFVCDGR